MPSVSSADCKTGDEVNHTDTKNSKVRLKFACYEQAASLCVFNSECTQSSNSTGVFHD